MARGGPARAAAAGDWGLAVLGEAGWGEGVGMVPGVAVVMASVVRAVVERGARGEEAMAGVANGDGDDDGGVSCDAYDASPHPHPSTVL